MKIIIRKIVIFPFLFNLSSILNALASNIGYTIPFNGEKTISLNEEQIKRGKRLFNNSCSICHTGGITKTNPNIGLDLKNLSLATPPKTNVESLIDFIKNPKTFDGSNSLLESHPSTKNADIFPSMQNLNDEDLAFIAGHILLQPRIGLEKWGVGKTHY